MQTILRATRSFTAEYDGEVIEVIAGQTGIDSSHWLARKYPDAFEVERAGRSASTERWATEWTLEEELEARSRLIETRCRNTATSRLQLDTPETRARRREDEFWRSTERLLFGDELRQPERERREQDEIEAVLDQAPNPLDELGDLEWLRDRPFELHTRRSG